MFRRVHLVAFCLVSLVGATSPPYIHVASGADVLREETSLGFVPQDVSVYVNMLRNREQVERFLKSNAYAKLKTIPFYQFGLLQLQAQWNNPDGPLAPVREIVESEEGRSGLAVLKEAVSDEIFFYADKEAAPLLALFQRINQFSNSMQFQALAEDGEVDEEEAGKKLLDELAKMSGDLRVPTMMMGFRVRDTQQAQKQIEVVERLARQALEDAPEVVERLQRTEIGSSEFLTLRLSGSMLPWEEILQEVGEESQEQAETLKQNISEKEFVIAFGVRGNYLLLSISPTTDALKLPSSPQLLIDRSEMARLRQFADRPLTSISYLSAEFLKAAAGTERQLNDMQQMATAMLEQAEIDEELREQITRDMKELSDDIKRYLPEHGAVAGFQFMTDEGFEGYTQNWTIPKGTDGSKPLSILEHAGGKPLAVFAGRGTTSVEDYDLMVKWFRKIGGYLQSANLREQLDEDQRKVWDHFQKHLPKMFERFNTITRDSLIPALADGQVAMVLDAQLTSTQWHRDMPQSDKALPLPTLSLLCGVSDADRLRQALADYWSLAGDLVRVTQEFVRENEAEIREELDDHGEGMLDAFLGFEWQFPKIEETESGEIYQLPLPEQAGVDPQITPSLGVASDVAVASISSSTVNRLMESTPLAVGGALDNIDRPLAGAVFVDIAGTIEVFKPWIGYVVDVAASEQIGAPLAMAEPQVITLLEIFQVFRGYSSATTVEGDSLLTHQKWTYQDLPQE